MYTIVVLVLCCQALSQPVSEDRVRQAHQIECCPCPSVTDGQDMLGGGTELARASGLDDCPCRDRGADSEGASSIFFPSTVRAGGPLMSHFGPKEDPKNLLEPEVALATSMLDTLREATEQEYQEALAREAAKSATDDALPEESGRNLVIIVNPRDSDKNEDIISDASHVQESRCVHPLASSSLGRMKSSTKPINLLPETLRFPNLKHPDHSINNLLHFDSDLGASNIEESVINLDKNKSLFESHSPMLNFADPFNKIIGTPNDFLYFKTNLNDNTNNDKESKHFSIPRISLVPKLNPRIDNLFGQDLKPAPSNVKELSDGIDDKINDFFKQAKLQLNSRNLLKLRDVEFIPNKSLRKLNLNPSQVKVPTVLKSINNNIRYNDCNRETKSGNSHKVTQNLLRSKVDDEELIPDSDINLDEKKVDTMKNTLDTNVNPSEIQESESSKENIKDDDETASSQFLIKKDFNCENNKVENPQATLKFKNSTSEVLRDSNNVNFTNKSPSILTEVSENWKHIENISQNDKMPQDSVTDSSNNLQKIVPLDAQERQTTDMLPQYQENFIDCTQSDEIKDMSSSGEENEMAKNLLHGFKSKITPVEESLLNLRQNTNKNIKAFKNLHIQSKSSQLSSSQHLRAKEKHPEEAIDNIDDEINEATNEKYADSTSYDIKDTTNHLTMGDLQEMSDKLLDSTHQKEDDFEKSIECETTQEIYNCESGENDRQNNSLETVFKFTPKSISTNLRNDKNVDENNARLINLLEKQSTSSIPSEEVELYKSNQSQDYKQNEMETGASDPVVNTLPGILDSLNSNLKLRTPLLENIIVQPTSNPLNILRKPLGDVLNLNPNLPTLDEIRDRLADIFKTNDRSVEEDYSSSLESDSTHVSPLNTLASEASTKYFQKKLPFLKNLENFNEAIPTNILPKTSKTNLNSYRTRVPVPTSLELKPLKIEPIKIDQPLRSLASGSNTLPRKTKPSISLSKPLHTLPTLDVLRNNLLSNSKQLLSNPTLQDLSLLPENIHSNDVGDIAETIRKNTQKTIKGLQRKMQSSLKKTKANNPLGDSFAKQQELLDDVTDKLKGIHYDLNDRLSSIHEHILDSSKFDAFRDPTSQNVMTNLRKPKSRPFPARLLTAASTINENYDPYIFESEPKKISMFSKSNISPEAKESSLTPIRVDLPKSANPPLSNLQRASDLRQIPTLRQLPSQWIPSTDLHREPITFKDTQKSILKTPYFNPFQNQRQPNKVMISFGTTTIKPITQTQPKLLSRVPIMNPQPLMKQSSSPNDEAKVFRPLLNHKLKSATDFKYAPSSNPLKSFASVQSPHKEFEDADDFSIEQVSNVNSNQKTPVFRETLIPNNKASSPKSLMIKDSEKEVIASIPHRVESATWPKASDNSFLSKVRDAVNMRKYKYNSKSLADAGTEMSDVRSEMLRSPSENTHIVINEPLKENVSYRCRMVCTKESR